MEDKQIIQLYFDRSEDAIRETAQAYGRYLFTIASVFYIMRKNQRKRLTTPITVRGMLCRPHGRTI